MIKEVVQYEGFIIPKDDASTLKANSFKYIVDDGCFTGILEDENGRINCFDYYPENHLWNMNNPTEEDFSGASEGDR